MRIRARLTLAALACTSAVLFTAQPALAQDEPESRPEGARGEGIPIPPSEGRGDQSPISRGPPSLPAPDGQPIIMRGNGNGPSVLAILAHPDDEITIAPILSRIARDGGDVTLVFATSGDAGPGVSGMEPGAELAELREGEARCSAFAMRLDEPIFWRIGDGTLAQAARGPDLVERVSALIGIEKPEVIMTWGPDGGYGHADHRMISAAVTEAVQSMTEARPTLLYTAFPADEDTSIPGFEDWATIDPSLVTDRLNYRFADLEAARGAIDCHVSQFDEQARAMLPDLLHRQVWNGAVHFRLAFPDNRER